MSDVTVAAHDEIIAECILTYTRNCNPVLVNPSWKHLVARELIDIIECMLNHYFRSFRVTSTFNELNVSK